MEMQWHSPKMAAMKGDEAASKLYAAKADTLKQLVETRLWNEKQQFFETRRPDSLANVREAIGYIPWYFNLPNNNQKKYEVAWLQLYRRTRLLCSIRTDYGRTASSGVPYSWSRTLRVGTAPVWPFATSQTLTGLANYLNSTDTPVVTDSVFFARWSCMWSRNIVVDVLISANTWTK